MGRVVEKWLVGEMATKRLPTIFSQHVEREGDFCLWGGDRESCFGFV